MENNTTPLTDPSTSPDGFAMTLSNQSLRHLWEVRRWGNFFSILGFVFIGLIIVVGGMATAFLGLAGSMSDMFDPQKQNISEIYGGAAFIVFYIIIGLIYYFPVLYLYRFSSHMKTAIQTRNETELTLAFKYLKSNFRFMGILCIVILALYALIFLFGIGFASMFF